MNSDYDLGWYGKTNNLKYTNFLTLCARGDIEKVLICICRSNSLCRR